MAKIQIKYKKIRDVKNFEYSIGNCGIDFFIPNKINTLNVIRLESLQQAIIPSGYLFNLPEGYALLFVNKSGQSTKKNLQVTATLVDSSYIQEVHLCVRNIGKDAVEIKAGEKLVQAIIIQDFIYKTEFEEVNEITKVTKRTGGFGSTDIKTN
ncbi:MAG: hypothetical protein LBV53_02960 [Mycoplasmataceae bacterium]|jgi:dUTP pyrophosphatase|nr:hypothetical protein [Mycoplasmataceae bacterium]